MGKVLNNIDPLNLGRIQVTFPDISDFNCSPWARIATMMAGTNEGSYFLPDIGDEVLVSFEKGDINTPVIVGGLWNGLARPPEFNKGLNAKKMISTKTGLKLVFDETPGKQNITLETLTGSTVTLSDTEGITIDSPTTIKLKVGTNSIEINPTGITIQGTQINLN